MLASDLMNKPSGSCIEIYNPSEVELRLLHWLGYHAKFIDGPRQLMVKLLAPRYVFQALREEEARYLAALRSGVQVSCIA
jgi:hypothetical protein